MPKIEVLHIFRNLKVGGNQITALDIIRGTNHNVRHTILTVIDDQEMSTEFKDADCSIIVLPPSKRGDIIKSVKNVIRTNDYHCVMTWFFPFALNFEIPGQKFIHHVGTAPTFQCNRKFIIELLYLYRFYKPQGKICFASNYIKSQYQIVFRKKFSNCIVINNGVNSDKFRVIASRQPTKTVTMVGRLDGSKNFEGLICSAARIKHRIPKLKINIVGDGPDRTDLVRLADTLGLNQNINFLGTRRDIPQILNKTNVFVFLNKPIEGFGIVLIEAMSCGLPVIANAVGASVEIINHNKNGLLVNTDEELDHSLIRVLNDSELAANLGKNARKTVIQKFSINGMVEKYAQEF